MKEKVLNILDIDLDFFLNNRRVSFGSNKKTRLNKKQYKPWDISFVISFLENQCGLNKEFKKNGKYFKHHDEVFYFLRSLQEKNNFNLKFSIDHIDAHADLGLGDSSYVYISSEILFKDLKERAYPAKINGWDGLSEGNFLSFAIACRWVSQLNYINKIEWTTDLPHFIFRNYETDSGFIQHKKFSPQTIKRITSFGDIISEAKLNNPIETEPDVPFRIIDYNNFKSRIDYDFIFITQSPEYTPATSDSLLPIINSYMNEYPFSNLL